MRTNLKLFTTFSKIANKNHDFMRVSEALIQFNCQTRVILSKAIFCLFQLIPDPVKARKEQNE